MTLCLCVLYLLGACSLHALYSVCIAVPYLVCVYVRCQSVPFCVSVCVCVNSLCGSVTLMLCFITSSHVKCPSSWQFSVFT